MRPHEVMQVPLSGKEEKSELGNMLKAQQPAQRGGKISTVMVNNNI